MNIIVLSSCGQWYYLSSDWTLCMTSPMISECSTLKYTALDIFTNANNAPSIACQHTNPSFIPWHGALIFEKNNMKIPSKILVRCTCLQIINECLLAFLCFDRNFEGNNNFMEINIYFTCWRLFCFKHFIKSLELIESKLFPCFYEIQLAQSLE